MSMQGDDFVERLTIGRTASSHEDMLCMLSQILEAERAKSTQLEQALRMEKRRVSDLEAIVNDFGPLTERKDSSTCVSVVDPVTFSSDEEVPGRYPAHVRRQKIARYKSKRQRRLQQVPVSRSFQGRSTAAQGRQRINGKFAKYC